MKRTYTFETGEHTCASEPGVFCPFVGTRGLGGHYVCMLFTDEQGRPRPLKDKDGWLQRALICKETLGTTLAP